MKKSLLYKMLLFIGLPAACIFCIAALIVLNNVKSSVSGLTANEFAAESKSASNQISEYFTKYSEAATQMATNTQFQKFFQGVKSGTKIDAAPGFADVKQSLINTQKSDPDNIITTWVSDIDSSQLAQSDGYVSDATFKAASRGWYADVMQKKATIITEPYEDTATKKEIVSVVSPVFEPGSGQLLGVTGIDFSINRLCSMVNSYKLGKTGFFILTTGSGKLICYPDQKFLNQDVSKAGMSDNIVNAMKNKTQGPITYTALGKSDNGYLSTIGTTGWTVTAGQPDEEYYGTYRSVQNTLLAVFGAALVLLIALIILMSKSVINPLRKLTAAARKIADGDLDVNVDVRSADETGQVATAISQTVVRLKEYIKYIDEISAILDQIADGNLAFEMHCDYAGEFGKIKAALENIQATFVKTFQGIGESANQVAAGSEQVAAGSQMLAQGATEQASSVEELSASITEVAGKIGSNASDASGANTLAGGAAEEMRRGNEQMNELIDAIREIDRSSEQIGAIIKTIQDIAFQTNILALNAAVEASRAGEAGKGFAVVADEVRNLAGKSAEAAKDTSDLIEASVASVKKGTDIAGKTAESINTVAEKVEQTASLISKISSASEQQANSIKQVQQGLEQISNVVQTNSATAEESAASSEELSGQAQTLKSLIEKFRLA